MAKKNTVTLVRELAEPIASDLGLTLWDVSFKKEGADWFLRVLADREGGITIGESEALSRAISEALDREDPISHSYYLEVGSPGIERELKTSEHFEWAKGKQILVRFIRPVDGEREWTGALIGHGAGTVTMRTGEEEKSFEQGQAAYIRIYYEGEENIK